MKPKVKDVQVANLLNFEVDLLFFDTTSTYFELEDPDTPVARDEHGHPRPTDDTAAKDGADYRVGFRTYGKSKDSRDGIPVRANIQPHASCLVGVVGVSVTV